MISPQEADYIYKYAYIPEQLPHYVQSITKAEPFLISDQMVYVRDAHCSLVAYPLAGEEAARNVSPVAIENQFKAIQQKFQLQVISLISPRELKVSKELSFSGSDCYHCLDLAEVQPDKKIRNQIKRAAGELDFSLEQKFDCRYKKLVNNFLKTNEISPEARSIFKRVARITRNNNCELLSVFNRKGKLVAFDLFDFSARNYGFYLFNFRSRREYIPGASDFLLWNAIKIAQEQGKRFLNLGLGIDEGIEKFKQKWGSHAFLDYYAYHWEPAFDDSVDELYAKL